MEDEKSKNYPHKWTQLGNASTRLLGEAEAMYWRAMKLEIASIVYALHEILAKKDGIPELVEGSPEYLNDSQRLSIRIIPYMKDWWPLQELPESEDFEVGLAREALFGVNGAGGARVHQNKPIEYRLARSLLSSAGFLDISKIVEYRPPQFPSQCGDPQLGVFENRVKHLKRNRMDVQFISLSCNDCDNVFRAPYYECSHKCPHKDFAETGETFAVCASCFLTTSHPQEHLKRRKLHSSIPESVAKELCQCPGVDNPLFVTIDFEGKGIDEWFDEREKAGKTLAGHVKGCQYLAMEAKRMACVEGVNDIEDKAQAKKLRKSDGGKYEPRFGEKVLKMFPHRMRERHFPMGNVHAAVMFGPVLIENGVARTKHGVVILPREPPDLGAKYTSIPGLLQTIRDNLDKILVVSGDKKRELFSAEHPELRNRKLNASVTQVLGGLFSDHNPEWGPMESSIITQILAAAKAYKPQLFPAQRQLQAEKLLQAADTVISTLKQTIGSSVHQYLHVLTRHLPNPNFRLQWNITSNNCQDFCDNLLTDFSTIFPPNPSTSSLTLPNYLLSFTARFPALSEETFTTSRLDTYFRSFHHELDIISTYDSELDDKPSTSPSEFALGRCDRLLLWPCMGKQCHLADHMWRHASDSISILQFHVLRAQGAYWNEIVSTDEAGNSTVLRKLSREEWVRQRVRVMLGIDVFLGLAAGIVRTYRRMEGLRIRMSGTFMDEGEFEEEERLPEASIEVIDGSMFLDPETGREREIELDEDIFGGGHGGGEGEGEWEPMYGNWSPGSSDTVGRKGPQWMADTEEGEEIVLEFYDKTWRHVRGR